MPNWKKIKQLSLDEVRVRAAQKWSAFGERHSIVSLGRLPDEQEVIRWFLGAGQSSDDLLDHFHNHRSVKFFPSFHARNKTIDILKALSNDGALLRKADDIQRGRFDLLGLKQLDFGSPPDWHFEPRSGKKTPLVHWSQLDYLDAEVAGDKKIVWELNRHQYFVTLGRAYWLTGKQEYATTFVEHLTSWMDHNPPKLGINWASSLEVSFRAISWLWAINFFKDSPALTSSLLLRVLQFLYVHARHLETYLSTYFSPNTHLTGEALGLFYLGTLLPELAGASRWRSLGAKILVDQLPIHVRHDGVYFEQSSYYHRYTADFYVHFLLLSRASKFELPELVEEKLTKLLDHLMYITRPDGLTPLFGDDDGGRFAMLSENRPNDFRSTISTAAALFDRSDYKFVAGELSEETLWLLGPKGCESFKALPATAPRQQSVAFNDGGYYVMRDGWSDTANYLLFDCGPHGQANCGHAHADALSFELSLDGEPILIDPGTYTYTGSQQEREWFRSSLAHNTLMIDGQSSSKGSGPFSWQTIARCKTSAWSSCPRFDYVSGSHDGFARLDSQASHSRSILFLKGDYWIMIDEVTAQKDCEVSLRFHPPATADTEFIGGNAAIRGHKASIHIQLQGVSGEWKQEEGWVSDCYARRESAPVLVYTARIPAGKSYFMTLLLPDLFGKVEVDQLEARGGLAFELRSAANTDFLLIRTRERVEAVTLSSDFDVTWARMTGPAQKPSELVVIGKGSVSFENRELLSASDSIAVKWPQRN